MGGAHSKRSARGASPPQRKFDVRPARAVAPEPVHRRGYAVVIVFRCSIQLAQSDESLRYTARRPFFISLGSSLVLDSWYVDIPKIWLKIIGIHGLWHVSYIGISSSLPCIFGMCLVDLR